MAARRSAWRPISHGWQAGCGLLGLPAPSSPEIAAAVSAVLAANELAEASIRITLTRGVGPRGLLPPAETKPTLLVAAFPLPPTLPKAMSACMVGMRRNEHSPLSQLKSLAYLDNILALREADAAGCDEAILLNTTGRIAGGSRSNLFLVLDGHCHHAAAERGAAARHRAADRAGAGEGAWDPCAGSGLDAGGSGSRQRGLPHQQPAGGPARDAAPGPGAARRSRHGQSRRTSIAKALHSPEAMVFDRYLALWQLKPDGDSIATRSSRLLPVRCRDDAAAMLKIAIGGRRAAGRRADALVEGRWRRPRSGAGGLRPPPGARPWPLLAGRDVAQRAR